MHSLQNASDSSGVASLDPETASSAVAQEKPHEHTRRQILWDRQMQTGTVSRKPYQKTAVLLISFADTDLKGLGREVNDLGKVFREDYGFHVDEAVIKSPKKAQKEMVKKLADFLLDHDEPQTLLIIYYAGHGWAPPMKLKEFHLAGKTSLISGSSDFVKWHKVEEMLNDTDADVFAIFDCCHAGRVCQYRGPVRFDILGACSADQLTAPPGPTSFTTALIWALKELRSEPSFRVSKLQQKIKEAPQLPESQQPPLAHRNTASPDQIIIAPHHKDNETDGTSNKSSSEEEGPDIVSEYFDVRLHFVGNITDKLVERTAETLNELLSRESKNILPIHRISYVGSESVTYAPWVQHFALSWLKRHRDKTVTPISPKQQKVKGKTSSLPTLQIPTTISAPTTLAVPHSATSEQPGSLNSTLCDDDRSEANEVPSRPEPFLASEQTESTAPSAVDLAHHVPDPTPGGTSNANMEPNDHLEIPVPPGLPQQKQNKGENGQQTVKVFRRKNRLVIGKAGSIYASLRTNLQRFKGGDTHD